MQEEKEAFTGSDRGIRFWIGKTELPVEKEEEESETEIATLQLATSLCWRRLPSILIYHLEENTHL